MLHMPINFLMFRATIEGLPAKTTTLISSLATNDACVQTDIFYLSCHLIVIINN